MADGYVDRLVYALDGDVGPFKAKAAQVSAEAARMGESVKTSTKDVFKPAADSAAALEKQIDGLKRKISSGLWTDTDVQKLKAASNQLATLGNDAKKTTEAIKLQGYQISSLGQQATDFIVQVGSGGGFFRPFLQQAPQAVDAVGGVGNAMKLLGGAAGIARLAIGGLVIGGITVMATAFIKGQQEAAQLEKNLALIGGAAGVTRGQIELLSKSIDGVGRGRARELLSGLAGSGSVPSSQLGAATTFANNYSRATGASTGEAAAYVSSILKDPAKGAADLYDKFNALSYAQERQVEHLVAMGDRQAAVSLILERGGTNFANAAEQAGYLERMLHATGDAAGGFWSWLKGVGRPDTPEERLADLKGANPTNHELYQNPKTGMYGPPPGGSSTEQRGLELVVGVRSWLAQQEEQSRTRGEKVKAALGVADLADVKGAEERRRQEVIAKLSAGIPAAAGNKALQEQLRGALANAQDPNYKLGSGVPKSKTSVSRLSILGDTANQELANAQQVADAPMRDRELLRARLAAELEYQRAIKQTGASEADAAKVRAAKIAEAKLAIQSRTKDVLQGLADETEAQNKVVQAYDTSTAAVQQQTIAGQAHLAWLKGEITDEKAYASALASRASAQALASTAQTLSTQRRSNQGLDRIIAAGGDPAKVQAAQIENEALATTQAARDAAAAELALAKTSEATATARDHLAKAEDDLAKARTQGADAADKNRTVNANDNYSRLQDQLTLSQKDYDLQFATADLRAREMSDLQTIIDLKREGWSVDDKDYQAELARRQKANRDIASIEVRKTLRDNAAAGIREGLEAAASGNFGALLKRKLYDAALDGLSKGIADALSSAGGAGSSGGGGFWSSMAQTALSIFGGGKALGGDLDPSRYYVVGENGPEILGPGVAGAITPMKAPKMDGMSAAATNQNVNFTYAITVAGNGDAELLGRVHQVVNSTVSQAIQTNNAGRDRTMTARLQQANNRQLR
jgi:hypothetical protein